MTEKESQTTTASEYNYDRFEEFDHEAEPERKVKAGNVAADGTLYRTDGRTIGLSSLWAEQPVVLEFGSITCPIFVGWIDQMDALAEAFRDEVDFYIVYSREAHPDDFRPAHRDLTEKMRRAKDLIAQESPDRTVLVDDVGGSVHRAYDSMPNSVYLVGTDGVVAYRADWVDPQNLERKIKQLLDNDGAGGAVAPESDVENFTDPRA